MTINRTKTIATLPGLTAEVADYRVWDVDANALVVKFAETHSTLSGEKGSRRSKIICNCYLPKELCDNLHYSNQDYGVYLKSLAKEIAAFYEVDSSDISMISTGVDMRELAHCVETHDELWVAAWVTAGFKHNAMRVGVDRAYGVEINGKYRTCGTINIIVTTNAKLSLATMASSFITITEAKGIALQDLRIHSSFDSSLQATGTGTDQIVVASGNEFICRYAGGHTKLGELMAKSVTKACLIACKKQLAKDPDYHGESAPSGEQ
ncbi:adenosylcobinamide amidohydrolase [Dehalogenimonas sp. THU2]|uniref:adenosylcobinamide amidohydrolase n=1 Tax=Dehalogenimonas sp. THU2 TaxID=3151121 RepID=UPI003218642C